jgi:hypothetical protein
LWLNIYFGIFDSGRMEEGKELKRKLRNIGVNEVIN